MSLFLFLAMTALGGEPDCKPTALTLKAGEPVTVTRVVDGDTLVLTDGTRVRMIGVDTPETKHPKKGIEPFGPEASAFTKKELTGEVITLIPDRYNTKSKHLDRYRRRLGYVIRKRDGLDFSRELVKRGFARAYVKLPSERKEEFLCLQRAAQSAKTGMWSKEVAVGN